MRALRSDQRDRKDDGEREGLLARVRALLPADIAAEEFASEGVPLDGDQDDDAGRVEQRASERLAEAPDGEQAGKEGSHDGSDDIAEDLGRGRSAQQQIGGEEEGRDLAEQKKNADGEDAGGSGDALGGVFSQALPHLRGARVHAAFGEVGEVGKIGVEAVLAKEPGQTEAVVHGFANFGVAAGGEVGRAIQEKELTAAGGEGGVGAGAHLGYREEAEEDEMDEREHEPLHPGAGDLMRESADEPGAA